ncbi:sensor histidine kinase [Streptomyces sp. NPDC054796]
MEEQYPILARWLNRRRLIVVDGVIVSGYTAVLLATGPAETTPGSGPVSGGAPPWEQLVLMVAATVPLALRRVRPLPVFIAVVLVTALAVARDAMWDPLLPAAFALYTVALTSSLRRWWERWLRALAIALLCVAAALGPVRAEPAYWWAGGPGLLLLGFAALLGAWELGRAVRQRRADAARTAEHLTQRAVTEERLRIARELHDVVTHSMGLIAVKAGVANHVIRTRPEEAYDALRVIETTSREALTDMRRMLGVLRSETDGARLPPSALGPAPGPDTLPELAERAGAELSIRGVEELPEGIGLTVHRIVQEALTNVARHAAPGTPCRVVVEGSGREVRIQVTDDGRCPARSAQQSESGGGHGILGMRERVAAYGGTFTAGPRPEGGFAVTATLPYKEAQ